MQLFIIVVLIYLLVGCKSASNYLHTTLIPKSEFLKKTELGLHSFHQSKHKESKKYFQDAVDIYRIDEDKPLVALSDIAVLEYRGKGYDKVLLHNYSALNYLMMGEIESAKVETKNSNFIQKNERFKFYDKIEKFKDEKEQYTNILDIYEQLFKSVDLTHNPYQNPFAYYVSALLYEEDNQYTDAYIDIKNALKYHHDSKILKDKLQLYKSDEQTNTKKRVELFFDIGKSPTKEQVKISVKTDKNREEMLYLPTFKLYKSKIDKIIVTDSFDKIVAKSSVLSDIDAIKVNEFKEMLPSLISKLATESGKEILIETLSQKSSSVGAMFKTISTVYSQNSLQTWSTLPKRIEVISFTPKKDVSYRLKIIDKDGKILNNKKLQLNCIKKKKNCYQYYLIKEHTK